MAAHARGSRSSRSASTRSTLAFAAVAFWVAGGALYGVSGPTYDHDKNVLGCGTTQICGSDVWGGTRTMERAGIGLMVTGGVLTALDVALWAAWRRR
jgi:hypothetical protein